MTARAIKGKDLAKFLNVSTVYITRLRNHDYIPPIGGRELEHLAEGITRLSSHEFEPCKISDLFRE